MEAAAVPPPHQPAAGLGRVADTDEQSADLRRFAAASTRDDENTAEELRAYIDVKDDLPVFWPECAEREFGAGEPDRV